MKKLLMVVGCLCSARLATAQSHPVALPVPVSQTWGGASFTALPAGFAAWNGLSGANINTQAKAEASAPAGNATVSGATPTNGGAGGCFGYAVAGNARFAINTSSNTTNGVNQLVMAINTTGRSHINLAYDLINVVNNNRTIGVVTQFRAGTSGTWTTIAGTGNPYAQSALAGGVVGSVTNVSLTLPAAAENQAVLEIRWAIWRGSEANNSSAVGIDNIAVSAGPPLLADLDHDGDVDADDLTLLGGCRTAPRLPYLVASLPVDCHLVPDESQILPADFDRDNDIDLDDFAVWQRCYAGPGILVDGSCSGIQ